METENDVLRGFWNDELNDERRGCGRSDPVRRRLKIVTFVSESNGRGRRKRKSRLVELIRDGSTGRAYTVAEDLILPRRNGGLRPDVLATEVLTDMPDRMDRTTDVLLARLRDSIK